MSDSPVRLSKLRPGLEVFLDRSLESDSLQAVPPSISVLLLRAVYPFMESSASLARIERGIRCLGEHLEVLFVTLALPLCFCPWIHRCARWLQKPLAGTASWCLWKAG